MYWSVAASAVCTAARPAVAGGHWQIERGVRWKFAVLGLMLRDDLGHQRVNGKAIAGKLDRRFRDLAEAYRAETFERGDPGIGRRRYHGAQDAVWNIAAVVLAEIIALDGFGPGPKPGIVTTRSSATE